MGVVRVRVRDTSGGEYLNSVSFWAVTGTIQDSSPSSALLIPGCHLSPEKASVLAGLC